MTGYRVSTQRLRELAKLARARGELDDLLLDTAKGEAADWRGELGFVSGVSDSGGCSGEGSVYLPVEFTRELIKIAIERIDAALRAAGLEIVEGE